VERFVSQSPVVSVVMPFLNVAEYLAEAIESVRAQTYPRWELLLVDDGATDGGTDIARRYAALDPDRIRWFEHPGHENRGASVSRNVGFAAARGDYFAMLDGDDVWLPHKLAEQVALLEATPEADVLCGSTEFWYGWTGQPDDARLDRVVRIGLPDGTLIPGPTMLAHMLDDVIGVPCTCSVVARRDAVRRVGGFEESFRRVFTDQAFYAKLFLESTVLVVDTCWDRYRLHAASSCAVAQRSGELATTRLRYLRWLSDHLASRAADSPQVRAALRRATWRVQYPGAARRVERGLGLLRSLRSAVHERLGV
jgi:glycosyltransferase involved in cell wall biosynthesis